MNKIIFSLLKVSCVFFLALGILNSSPIHAQNRTTITQQAQNALNQLLKSNADARVLNNKAVAVLVFPSITKAGIMIGGQYGDGVLLSKGKAIAYYNTTGVSYGMQIGAQEYGYAMFFMKQSAITALDSTDGFEVGVGPSVVVVDEGFAKTNSSINLQEDIYAFIFNQKGLMAGLGIQGNKITRLKN
ncbi:lipoprotein [Polynucleobacter sp. SHI8]|uniref:lipid-binding SYLF domain-containing protein n=1 Tax=unclassified Polynucleobacter TaxID=2640945 RepID=UPI002490F2DE|nr:MULTISPECIES: lipid-binding SYLF domain-containing protein [unclassified Polynucleobacter]BDW11603.1 lipoprotein [Polynucleobacter sp. SHI2]BDW14050.1 lipoprotein [Polynucleobacter sp. SHI8]